MESRYLPKIGICAICGEVIEPAHNPNPVLGSLCRECDEKGMLVFRGNNLDVPLELARDMARRLYLRPEEICWRGIRISFNGYSGTIISVDQTYANVYLSLPNGQQADRVLALGHYHLARAFVEYARQAELIGDVG